MQRRNHHDRGVGLFLCAVALILATAAASHADCRDKKNTVEVSVTLDWEKKEIVVEPESVEVYLFELAERPGKVCWTITGLKDAQALHIGGKEHEIDRFPNRDRKVKYPKDTASSGRPAMSGTWRYQLWVTKDDEVLLRKDPEIIIRPNR